MQVLHTNFLVQPEPTVLDVSCAHKHTLSLRDISGLLTFAWWFRLLIARVMPAPPPCRIIAALPGTMLSKEIETMTWVVLHHNYSFMSTVQNQMVHFRSTAAKLHTGNFSSSLVWTGLPFWLPCSQGLSTHKQSDLFKLSISEFCYLITSGGAAYSTCLWVMENLLYEWSWWRIRRRAHHKSSIMQTFEEYLKIKMQMWLRMG